MPVDVYYTELRPPDEAVCRRCRGILAIELLRELERLSGQPIYEMFDLICGVSTGALLGCLLGERNRTDAGVLCTRIFVVFRIHRDQGLSLISGLLYLNEGNATVVSIHV